MARTITDEDELNTYTNRAYASEYDDFYAGEAGEVIRFGTVVACEIEGSMTVVDHEDESAAAAAFRDAKRRTN
jgi:5-enolpyruvylshikimate-3-phosphate synthase